MNSPTASLEPSEFTAVQTAGVFMPLTQFGAIDVKGDDAASFLHTQLTNDVQHLDASTARLAGYCSPKGRCWRRS
jgi:folate-binding Fe-S cluster repair protein YgfZ